MHDLDLGLSFINTTTANLTDVVNHQQFSPAFLAVTEGALDEARRYNHRLVLPEHYLLAIAGQSIFKQTLAKFDLYQAGWRKRLEQPPSLDQLATQVHPGYVPPTLIGFTKSTEKPTDLEPSSELSNIFLSMDHQSRDTQIGTAEFLRDILLRKRRNATRLLIGDITRAIRDTLEDGNRMSEKEEPITLSTPAVAETFIRQIHADEQLNKVKYLGGFETKLWLNQAFYDAKDIESRRVARLFKFPTPTP